MQQIHPNIYVEQGFSGVTVGAVVSDAGVACIDAPSLPEDSSKWQHKLLQLGSKPILFVVNTDHHRDRVVGTQWLGAPVITHENTRQLIRGYPEAWRSARVGAGSEQHPTSDLGLAHSLLPEVTFTTKMVLHCGETEIHLLHYPGSTPGATWVWVPDAKVIFTGDSVFQDTHPFLASAQLNDWQDSLKHLRQTIFRDHTIVPGRSGPIDHNGLQFSVDYLRYLRRRLSAWREQGILASDAHQLAPALLDRFPVTAGKNAQMESRLKAGLQHVFTTLRT